MTLLKLTQRIRQEFEESPGLRVTVDEGAPLWGLRPVSVCQTANSPRRNAEATASARVLTPNLAKSACKETSI